MAGIESNDPPPGVVVLTASDGTAEVRRQDRLLFYPVRTETEEPPAAIFAEGENLEDQHGDYGKAAAFFRALTRAPDLQVRAGALLRLGRNLRKAGRNGESLAVFEDSGRLGEVSILGCLPG